MSKTATRIEISGDVDFVPDPGTSKFLESCGVPDDPRSHRRVLDAASRAMREYEATTSRQAAIERSIGRRALPTGP